MLVLSRREPYPPQEEQYPHKEISSDGSRIIRFDIPVLLTRHFYLTPRLSVVEYFLRIIQANVKILRAAIQWKTDVVHVQELPFSPAGLVVAKLMRVPMLLEFRTRYSLGAAMNMEHLSRGIPGRLLVPLVLKLFALVEILMYLSANVVICISEEEKANLVRLGIPPTKIAVICHMPDTEEFSGRGSSHIGISPITIVYAGTLNPAKGVGLLLEAFNCLHREVSEVSLVVLGDGPERASLEAQARRLSIVDKVRFLGWLDPRDAFDVIRASDVAVIPHTASSVPSKMFSYMHCGKPIVASDFPSVRRVLEDAQCGVLFRRGDAKDLACKLKLLLLDEALRIKLGANAQTAARRKYNWQSESQKLLAIYSGLGTTGGSRS